MTLKFPWLGDSSDDNGFGIYRLLEIYGVDLGIEVTEQEFYGWSLKEKQIIYNLLQWFLEDDFDINHLQEIPNQRKNNVYSLISLVADKTVKLQSCYVEQPAVFSFVGKRVLHLNSLLEGLA